MQAQSITNQKIKQMKEKITGGITFICSLGGLIGGLILMLDNEMFHHRWFTGLILFLLSVNVCLFVYWTRFGTKSTSGIDKIENENKILRKKIEQKELEQKLESLNSISN